MSASLSRRGARWLVGALLVCHVGAGVKGIIVSYPRVSRAKLPVDTLKQAVSELFDTTDPGKVFQ